MLYSQIKKMSRNDLILAYLNDHVSAIVYAKDSFDINFRYDNFTSQSIGIKIHWYCRRAIEIPKLFQTHATC